MNIPNRMTRAEAQAEGYQLDTTCYPWIAYKGARFGATEQREVFTDLEAEFVEQQRIEERRRAGYAVEIDMLLEDADRIRWDLNQYESSVDVSCQIFRNRLLNARHACPALDSYSNEKFELDTNDKSVLRVTAAFRKTFGDSTKEAFIAEVRVVVTPDDFFIDIEVLRPTLQRYDDNTCFRLERQFAFSVVTLLNRAVDKSKEQIAYVVEKEGLAETARLDLLNAGN